MSTANGKPMPRTIDEPDQVLLWSVDELIPVATIFGIGITSHELTASVVIIFLFLKSYRRFREGRPNGYFQHLMYWYGFAGNETMTIRNPFIRRFIP